MQATRALTDMFLQSGWTEELLESKGFIESDGTPAKPMVDAMLAQGWAEDTLLDRGLIEKPIPKMDGDVAKYIKLRDEKAAIEKKAKEEKKKLDEEMEGIGQKLGAFLTDAGVTSQKYDSGTVFFEDKKYVSSPEHDKFVSWLVEGILNRLAANGMIAQGAKMADLLAVATQAETLGFLTKAVAKEPVVQYVDKNGNPPPGLKYIVEQEISVRRPAKK